MPHGYGLDYYHRRKKKHIHRNSFVRLLDRLIYIIVFFGILMAVPQVLEIWVKGNASGVSAISWASLGIVAFFWLIYGIVHREKPMIVAYCLWLIIDILIAVGVLVIG